MSCLYAADSIFPRFLPINGSWQQKWLQIADIEFFSLQNNSEVKAEWNNAHKER